MKVLRIVLLSLLALIIVCAIAGGIYINHISKKALPDYSSTFQLPGNTGVVKVFRDSTAMPHIYANNEKDLYRTAGYLMAQDRMWQMDLLRRVTQGRLSEIFGERMLTADQLFRSLHFPEKSDLVLDSCPPVVINCLEAYAEGINRYLTDYRDKLPPEFTILGYEPEVWTPQHSANLIGYMAWGLSMSWSMEVNLFKIGNAVGEDYFNDLVPDLSFQDEVVFPQFSPAQTDDFLTSLTSADKIISELGLEVFMGSNNWAVSGWKSENGSALLANDMHLELNAPGIWYQAHMVVPGKLDVSGVVLPGQPFVICGHNEDVAWGMTNVMLDDIDFYLETINPDDSLQYMFNGEWKDLKVEREVIRTKGGDSVIINNLFTHRGPVISGIKGIKDKVISMRWIGNEYSNEINSVYKFNRMKNWEEFREAAATFIAISQNIAYADKEGNIGIQTAGGVPIRKGEGIFIVPGDTSLYDWTGILEFDALPFRYNPNSGIVASANNRTAGDEYPYYISRWFDLPNRYERIVEYLVMEDKISIEDFINMQSDVKSKWAEKLTPYFTSLLEEAKGDANEKALIAIEKLSSWDYYMDKESIAATIFEQFYTEFLTEMFLDELGEELFASLISQDLLAAYLIDKVRLNNTSVWFDNVNTLDTLETASDLAIKALNTTVENLTERLGRDTDEWQWGKVHTLTLNHPLGSVSILNKAFRLNKGPFPVGGSYHTVSAYSYPLDDLFHVNHGSSHRHIYVCGDWDKSLTILPTGISGIPASPYYCSMTENFLNNIYKQDFFSREEIENNALYRIEIRE